MSAQVVLNNSFGALTQLKLSAFLNSECKANEVERRGSENTKRLNYYISPQINFCKAVNTNHKLVIQYNCGNRIH